MNKKYLKKKELANHIRLGVGLVLYKENQLLLEERVDCKNWGLIGGRVEVGESIEDAAVRECFEETSIKIKKEKLKLLGIYSDINQYRIINYPDNCFHAIDVIFSYQVDKNIALKKSEESIEVKFFKISNLPIDIVPPAKQPINEFIKLGLICNN